MNWDSPLDAIVNLIAAGAFLGFLVFVVVYASFSNWRATPAGRALMYAVGSLDLVVLMSSVHLFAGPYPGIEFVRIGVYSTLFTASWRLVWTLIAILRAGQPITVHSFVEPKSPQGGAMTNLTTKHLDERVVLSNGATIEATQATTGTPTQVSNPSRASWRTFVQSIVPTAIVLNIALPVIYGVLTSPEFAPRLGELLGPVYGWITVGMNVAIFVLGLLAKVAALLMANPVVNAWITKHLPWLAPIKPLT